MRMHRIVPMLAVLAACTDSPTEPAPWSEGGPFTDVPEDTFERFRADGSERRGGPTMSQADVNVFAEPGRVVGRSRLQRGDGGVRLDLHASDLAAGHGTTLWVVVFNDPSACDGECDDPDLFSNPGAKADLLFADGDVSNADGRVRFAATVAAGDASASIMPLFGLPTYGILDAGTAEIHLIVRDHGPLLPGLEQAQVTTFNGGCNGFGPEYGAPGPNTCTEPYFSSHLAN